MPDTPSTNVVVRVVDYLDTTVADSSDAPFEIVSSVPPETDPPVLTFGGIGLEGSLNDPTVSTVTVDGQTVPVTGGMFSATVSIGAGVKSFTVTAVDIAGATGVRNITVTP